MSARKRKSGPSLSYVTVEGFKCLSDRQTVTLKPLTLLAGANSSGKSSVMQPLLLLKQTLDAGYDPGPILLDGPNVRLTEADQALSRIDSRTASAFTVGFSLPDRSALEVDYTKADRGFRIKEMRTRTEEGSWLKLREELRSAEISRRLPDDLIEFPNSIAERIDTEIRWQVSRDRCFLDLSAEFRHEKEDDAPFPGMSFSPAESFARAIRNVLHLPGLRGNPERTYPVSAVGATFPGTFQTYAASVLAHWQDKEHHEQLTTVNAAMEALGLTWKVRAEPISDTQVRLRVGRLPRARQGGAWDLVDVADVGLGVSQTLPVVVALAVARRGQMVHLEQPEIHLHPRAQFRLAEVITDATARGVTVVLETHSALLMLGLQTLVAEGRLSSDDVALHWFRRSAIDGSTNIDCAELSPEGGFGDWPIDFGEIRMAAESRFLDAAETKLGLR